MSVFAFGRAVPIDVVRPIDSVQNFIGSVLIC